MSGPTDPQSLMATIVDTLPAQDREILRRGAVLRSIDEDLAEVVTGSAADARVLLEHPLLDRRGGGEVQTTMPEPLRAALLAGWDDGADEVRSRVVDAASTDDLEALYARLSTRSTRSEALRDVADQVNAALEAKDVPAAHDLLRMLDEWPLSDDDAAIATRERLTPALRRYGRSMRDREITMSYLERDFETDVWNLLEEDDGPWMLHVHAPGGMGKTMFIRHMLGSVCPPLSVPVARIDFDYVARLGIATNEPWRLLLSIASQLDPQLPGAPFDYMLRQYGRFQALLFAEALPGSGGPHILHGAGWNAQDDAARAASDVARRFRSELAQAVDDGLVLVALDTVENVLHTDGADIMRVLSAFEDVVRGGDDDPGVRVPGLRVIVSGRFDLADDRLDRAGQRHPRAPGFHRHFVGVHSTARPAGSTTMSVGEHVATLEIPGFSTGEAQQFLRVFGGLTDDDVVDVIARRCRDNPMKLALLAEYVADDPHVTAERIAAFDRVDLIYLVHRVVDRIQDTLVQWVLRWGALQHLLTYESVEQIIWPALEMVAERGAQYDDAATEGLPEPIHETSRWATPTLAEVTAPHALGDTWNRLLDYAATASWVSVVPGSDTVIAFHPDVRVPLRRLLRAGRHPAYDDIHHSAYAYWTEKLQTAEGSARITALTSMVFHAYETWNGAPDGDQVWQELIDRYARDRTAREHAAREVLSAARRLDSVANSGDATVADDPQPGGPSRNVCVEAHLEIAEAALATALDRGAPVDEVVISSQLGELTERERAAHPRRVALLDGALHEARAEVTAAWRALREALLAPAPAEDVPRGAHVELLTRWAAMLPPIASTVETGELLLAATANTPWAPAALRLNARLLLAAERWTDARQVGAAAAAPDVVAEALVSAGYADEVLAEPEYPKTWRANAALLQYQPGRALAALGLDAGQSGQLRAENPTQLLIVGRVLTMLGDPQGALDVFSRASVAGDASVTVDAVLDMAQLMARLGETEAAFGHLARLVEYRDALVVARMVWMATWLVGFAGVPAASAIADELTRANERLLGEHDRIVPSARVGIALARLTFDPHAPAALDELASALAGVEGQVARLLTLRLLDAVAGVDAAQSSLAAQRLRWLTRRAEKGERPEPVAAVLARVELERVLGDLDAAQRLLRELLEERHDPDGSIARAASEVQLRIDGQARAARDGAPSDGRADAGAEEATDTGLDLEAVVSVRVLEIGVDRSRGRSSGVLRITESSQSSAYVHEGSRLLSATGVYDIGRLPERVFDELGHVLSSSIGDATSDDGAVHLRLADPEVAQLPWELATREGQHLFEHSEAVVRVGPPRSLIDPDSVASRVAFDVLEPRKDRGDVAGVLTNSYGSDTASRRMVLGLDPQSDGDDLECIVHIVGNPVQRKGVAVIEGVTGGFTPESLAHQLGNRSRLLILDLPLYGSSVDIAEQVMLANAFCWHLTSSSTDLTTICGTFAASNDRLGSLQLLVEGLTEGWPIATLAGALQRHQPRVPGGRHPLRDLVTVSTDAPQRRFLLEMS